MGDKTMLISETTLTTARQRCASAPAWLRAIDRAAVLLPSSTVERLPAGAIRIVSARSGAAYVVSSAGCTCTGAQHGRACWHRAAARLAQLERQILRCRYCGAEMRPSTTIGGERSYTCCGCGHEAHAAAVEPGAEVA